MKKIFSILLVSVFLLPLVVKADRDLNGEILLYSEQTTVGSTVVLKVTSICDNSTCDGVLIYNKDVLEYTSIDYNYVGQDVGPNNGSVKVVSNENGTLKYDFNDPDLEGHSSRTSIIAKFVVKSQPSNNQIDVVYAPVDKNFEIIEGLKVNKVINVSSTKTENIIGNIDDSKIEEKVEQVEDVINKVTDKVTGEKECPKCEDKKCNNLWFIIGIISLVINALLIVVIIIISKNKNNKKEDKVAENAENTSN